jgi:predicted RNA-binding protein with RPS1 domain
MPSLLAAPTTNEGAWVWILGAFGITSTVAVAVVVIVIAVATNADKAQIIAGASLRLFRWVGLGIRRVSTRLQVEGKANEVLDRMVYANLDSDQSVPAVRLEMHLVREAEDPVIHSDGRVIVRMRDEGDPTRNVLRLVSTAAPKAIVPDARPYLEADMNDAINLQLIRKIARLLGPQAQKIFHAEYLPAARFGERPTLQAVLRRLHHVDEGGLFENVLLQEISYLGMRARDVAPDPEPLRAELREFVERLEWLATREPGDEREDLLFNYRYLRVGFILLAKQIIAGRGAPPYVRRLHTNIALGAESIYLLSLATQHAPFFHELVNAFCRVESVEPRHHFRIYNRLRNETQWLALFRRTDFAPAPGAFLDRLDQEGIREGSVVHGDVIAVGARAAMVSVDGIPAYMKSSEMAWGYRGQASQFLSEGQRCKAVVTAVDEARRELRVSSRLAGPSPWDDPARIPKLGERYPVQVAGVEDDALIVYLPDSKMFGLIPKECWALPAEEPEIDDWGKLGEVAAEARVMFVDPSRDYLRLSRRAVEVNWADVRSRYTPGTAVTVKVVRLEPNGLICEIEAGVPGWLEGKDLAVAGYEFGEWRSNVVVGQRIQAVVRLFQSRRERFTLQLPKNRWVLTS